MGRFWWFVVFIAVVCATEGMVPASLHHEFSDLADADGDGVVDSLALYLAEGGVELPSGYDALVSDLDGDGMPDAVEWVLGTDPLAAGTHYNGSPSLETTSTGMVLRIALPESFGGYAEVFGRESLLEGGWHVFEGWIPTYGAEAIELDIVTESNTVYFLMGCDATFDLDLDGYSDWMEYLVTGTDAAVFDLVDSDLDGLHDWWELKLFGDLDEDLFGDFDGDGLANGEELVWLAGDRIVMLSDPALFDTDGDARGDGLEVLSLKTDPLNSDTTPPVVSFSSIY